MKAGVAGIVVVARRLTSWSAVAAVDKPIAVAGAVVEAAAGIAGRWKSPPALAAVFPAEFLRASLPPLAVLVFRVARITMGSNVDNATPDAAVADDVLVDVQHAGNGGILLSDIADNVVIASALADVEVEETALPVNLPLRTKLAIGRGSRPSLQDEERRVVPPETTAPGVAVEGSIDVALAASANMVSDADALGIVPAFPPPELALPEVILMLSVADDGVREEIVAADCKHRQRVARNAMGQREHSVGLRNIIQLCGCDGN